MMRIRVTDWTYKNIRGLGTQSIELGLPPKRCSLIQMPNGLGKTTTMELIRAVLSGQNLSTDDVRAYRLDDTVQNGAFEIGLLIDGVQYRLTVDFDFHMGLHKFSTLRPKTRGGGREVGRVLPLGLKQLLKPQFTRLFVFDGELAKQIREVDKAEADHAIKSLYQLDELGALRHRVMKVVERRQEEAASVSSAKSLKGLSQRRNALNEAKSVLTRLEQKLSDFKKRESKLIEEADRADIMINNHIAENDDMKAEKKKIESEKLSIREKLQSATTIALDVFRLPTHLSSTTRSRLTDLGRTLTDARLPRSVSSEFFSELAEKDRCICGRAIGVKERTAIYHHKDEYLAQDQITAISTMKEKLKNAKEPAISYQAACEDLGNLMKARKENEWRRDKLIQSLTEVDDGEVEALRDRLVTIRNELTRLRSEVERLETKDTGRQKLFRCTAENNIRLAKKRVDENREKLRVAESSFRLARQRDVLVEQLSRIERKALNILREKIRVATNKRLENLILLEQLRVSKIDGALSMTSDRVAERVRVSEGQSLSVAYAFLTSLLSKAPIGLPFIVDSPAVSLDLDVRREVGRIIPDLFEQMIMFVISSEQAGFADAFYGRDDTRFVSLGEAPGGGILCEYGVEAFKRHAERVLVQ